MNILVFLMAFSCLGNLQFSSDDIAKVSEAVYEFSKGADTRDVAILDHVLHDNFRAIVNQAMGSKEIQIIDKTTYLELLKKEAIGGDARTVTILSIDMEENNAIVKAKLVGKALTFTTFIQVVKNADGEWQVMSDLPKITKAE